MIADLCTVIDSSIFGNEVKDLHPDDEFAEFQESFEQLLAQADSNEGLTLSGTCTMWGDN